MTFDTQSEAPSQDGEFDFATTADLILDSMDEAVLVADRAGAIQYRSAVAKEKLPPGNDLNTVLKGADVLAPFESWDAELARVIDSNSAVQFECALAGEASKPRHRATIRCTPLRAHGSEHKPAVVMCVLLTAEPAGFADQIEVSKRLTSLGKLATRVAHELNNPLDGILRYINLAMRVANDVSEPKLKSYLAESRTGAMRMIQIIGDLLEFSRTTDGEFQESEINELVEQAVHQAAPAAQANKVIVAVDFQTQEMPVVSGSRLYQVCCNLIRNAVEAMSEGGQLTITTGIVEDNVVIRVADTGTGLPTPVEKVFQPFFTTKRPGEGTGLGLAICKDFVEDMQGTIVAEQGVPGGSVFTVRIPVSGCHRPSPIAQSITHQRVGAIDASPQEPTTREQL